jgi:hypothetical protein
VIYVPHAHHAGQTNDERVLTTQVAPTIMRMLDLKPELLQSVAIEGTRALPEFDRERF